MMSRWLCALAASASLAGCIVDDGDANGGGGGGGKADGNGTCEDEKYGDGTCHADLTCGIPDIDCFHVFASDAEAAAEASQIGRGSPISESDARWVRARALTDRAWELYKQELQLGKLAEQRLSVVVLDNPDINAFVSGQLDGTKVNATVYYHSAILEESVGDEELLGVVFHELAHMSGLHVLPEVAEKMERFYLASGAVEPRGSVQPENPKVRTHAKAWMGSADLIGAFSQESLGDLPLAGTMQSFFTWYAGGLTTCTNEVNATYELMNALYATAGLDDNLRVSAALQARIKPALDALQACGQRENTQSLAQLLAFDTYSLDYLRGKLSEAEQPLLDNTDVVGVLRTLTADRRAKLRAQEDKARREGVTWTKVRYFSYEENADDVAVRMTDKAGFAKPGVSALMSRMLGDKAAACDAANPAPYGVHLEDPHHGTCWRVAHAKQLAGATDAPARRLVDEVAREAWVVTKPATGEPMY